MAQRVGTNSDTVCEALKLAEKFQGGGHTNHPARCSPNRCKVTFVDDNSKYSIFRAISTKHSRIGFAFPRSDSRLTSPPLMPDSSTRADGRSASQLRPLRFQNGIAPYATGSTLIEWGNTRVICGVTIEETVPRWMKEQKVEGGWITAEYSMLPYSTLQRKPRDISKGKLDGRSSEIQREA